MTFDPDYTVHPAAPGWLSRPADDPSAAAELARIRAATPDPEPIWRPGDHGRQIWDPAGGSAGRGGWRIVPVDPDTGELIAGDHGRYSLALGTAYDPVAEPDLARWAAVLEDPAGVPPEAAAGSLDTEATSRHYEPAGVSGGTPAGSPSMAAHRAAERDARDLGRMLDADRIKRAMIPLVAAAAGTWRAGETCDCPPETADRPHLPGCAWAERHWLGMRSRALDGCREVRGYRDALCGGYTARPTSCRVRVCPDCERARSARLVARLDGLQLDMARPVFWTLTIPNVPHGRLSAGVDVLLEAFRALRRRAIFRGGKCRGCGETHAEVPGGVYSIEVTPGRDRASWHPHVHVLMDSPGWVRWAELRDAWRAVTCDATRRAELPNGGRRGTPVGTGARPARITKCDHRADDKGRPLGGCRGASVVWVETIKGEPGSPERRAALREVLKYSTGGLMKDGKLAAGVTAASMGELLLSLRNRRLVAGWGAWRHVQDEDPEDELPDELGDETVWVDTGATRPGPGGIMVPILERMPARCPCCGGRALWELPVMVPRRQCRPVGGILTWRPPPAGPPS